MVGLSELFKLDEFSITLSADRYGGRIIFVAAEVYCVNKEKPLLSKTIRLSTNYRQPSRHGCMTTFDEPRVDTTSQGEVVDVSDLGLNKVALLDHLERNIIRGSEFKHAIEQMIKVHDAVVKISARKWFDLDGNVGAELTYKLDCSKYRLTANVELPVALPKSKPTLYIVK